MAVTDGVTNLNLNKTTSSGMSPLMEAVLNRYVLERNKQERKYTKFGQKVNIPKGKTKTIAFDKLSPLPKATQPLTEGVTPVGSAVHITRIKGEPEQFGNYVSYTDQLDFFAHDPSPEVLKYTELLTENQLETYEHLDAMELSSGLNVFYTGSATSRSAITDTLTVKDVRRAVTSLKRNKVQPADGKDYIAFVHPDAVFDLWSDEEWRQPHTYVDTENMYTGEIGKIFGVRFIEDPDACVFRGDPFADKYDELSILKVDGTKIYVAETIESGDVSDFSSKKCWINNVSYTISSATAGTNGEAYLTLSATPTGLVETDMKIYPGDGGTSAGKPVYSTVILGKNAFGTSGDNTVEIISKALGSAGTSDPLNQRGTMGWKGFWFTKILEQSKMVRIESIASV